MCTATPRTSGRALRALALALAWAAAAPAAAQEVFQVPVDEAYPPLSHRDDTGALTGFDVAVAQALARRMGGAAEFVPRSFFEIEARDWPPDWAFAVASMTKTDRRSERFDFIGPYYYDTVVLIAPDTGEEGALPREGDRIGVCAGCSFYRDYLEGNWLRTDGSTGDPPYPGIEVVEFTTDTDILRELGKAEEDALDFGISSARFADHFEQLGFPLRVAEAVVLVSPVYIVVPLDREEMAGRVRAAFEEARDAGEIAALSEQYLGRDFTDPETFDGD